MLSKIMLEESLSTKRPVSFTLSYNAIRSTKKAK